MSEMLTSRPFWLAISFLAGIAIECVILLQRRPSRWALIIFGSMVIYMSVLMFHSMSHTAGGWRVDHILPAMVAMGGVISFLFVAIFLKSLLRVIGEGTIISMTTGYWLTLLTDHKAIGSLMLVILVILSLPPTIGTFFLAIKRKAVGSTTKFLFYGWYLFMNIVFAFIYFSSLPALFFLSGGLRTGGDESLLSMFLLGMVLVHIAFNGGLLYYTIVYSLISTDARARVIGESAQLFGDSQADACKIGELVTAQAVVAVASLFLETMTTLFLASIWIVMAPLADIFLKRLGRRGRGPA